MVGVVAKDKEKPSALVLRIRNEFPNLRFSRSEMLSSGEDHAVLVLDGTWAFRFPRTPAYARSFHEELKLLKLLKKKVAIEIPDYRYISERKDFGGYPLIKGPWLTVGRFTHLSRAAKQRVIADLARFTRSIHSLPTATLSPSQSNKTWMGVRIGRYEKRYREERRGLLLRYTGKEYVKRFDAFFREYTRTCKHVPRKRIIHGDIYFRHLILKPDRSGLRGVIDFGDAAVADPAHDFAYLWAYGKDVPYAVYRKYGLRDRGLLARSRLHFIRYQIDGLYFAYKDGKQKDIAVFRRSLRNFGILS